MKVSICQLIITAGLTLLVPAASVNADMLCEVRVDCPMNYTRDPIEVANNSVLLSSVFDHCAPDSVVEDLGTEPDAADSVAIFIILDHSGSMKVYDSTNIRFDIVNQFIDSVYARSPGSQIGLAVFSNQLLHSYEDDSWFVPLFTGTNDEWHDSYIPLTKLSDSVDGTWAVEKLKWTIELSDELDLYGMKKLANGNYDPTGRHDPRLNPPENQGYNGATDISLGFEAAKHAFERTSYGAENQIIIFISDGEAQHVDVERDESINDYIHGEAVPTTFTVVIGETVIPSELEEMNDNIRNNGYSSFNDSSDIWDSRVTRQEDILDQFLTKIEPSFEPNLGYYRSTPVSMTINGIDALSFTDSTVIFPPYSFPLLGTETVFDISYTYAYTTTPEPVQYTKDYQVRVAQSDTPQFESVNCWMQDSISLFHNGNNISVVDESMERLELRFFPETELHDSIVLSVYNSSFSDSLSIELTNRSVFWNNSFDWTYGTPQTTDNILQIGPDDSIVVIYRNPLLPLDTVRIAFPVIPVRDLGVRDAWYLDYNADGFPDAIKAIQGEDRLSAQECSVLVSSVSVLTNRNVTVKDIITHEDGFVIRLEPPAPEEIPFTGLYPLERLAIERTTLPSGAVFPAVEITIEDKMAPVIVNATYFDHSEQTDTLRVVFSEPVTSIESNEPFIFRIDGREIVLSVEEERRNDSQVVFSLISAEPENLSDQDSIRIHVEALIGDILTNTQLNEENRIAPLRYMKVYNALNAYYHDKDNDGFIDLISITTDRIPDSAALDQFISAISLPEFRNFTYTANDFVLTDSGFVINVNQENVTSATSTDFRDAVTVSRTQNNSVLINESSLTAIDNLAPVITKALYIDSENQQGTVSDTLIVTFSEGIVPPTSRFPFTFTTDDNTEYTMELTFMRAVGENEYMFIVEDIIGSVFPQEGDSVSINPSAEITDRNGCTQDSENRKTTLIIRYSQQKFRFGVSQNPFNLTDSEIPPSVRSRFAIPASHGLVFMVEPLTRAARAAGFRARFTLYDRVGNMVVQNSGEKGADNTVYFVWNGKNKLGRAVGTGTYMLKVTIENPFGQPIFEKALIGIYRK